MILKLNDVSYYYKDGSHKRHILSNTNCSFEKGKFYTILGKSGAGKTTLLALLSALDTPQSGSIYFNDKDIIDIGYQTYRRDNIGIIFQHYNLVSYLTAVENVMVASTISSNDSTSVQKAKAYELLLELGIDRDTADRRVTQVSGGEQQRIAIARALSSSAEIIIADEPTGNLDESRSLEIIEIFKQLAHERDKCVIVVTHSQEVANGSDQTILLRQGKLSFMK